MRSEWTGSIAVALVAVGCSSPKFDPLLPMNEAGPKFIAANCPVPVKVHRRTVGEGDAARVLVDHDCLYDRDGDALSLTMTMTFDEATKQVVELQVMAGAGHAIDVDAPFVRAYTALIEPYLDPSRREAIRKFAMSETHEGDMADPTEPSVTFRRLVGGRGIAWRSLTITRRLDPPP